jgi:hypothetical protein
MLIIRVSPDERRRLETELGRQVGLFAASNAEAVAALRRADVIGIVWELSDRIPGGPTLPSMVRCAANDLPLLVHAELRRPIVRDLVALSTSVSALQVSICGFDDLVHEVRQVVNGRREPSPDQAILNTVASHTDAVLDIVAMAAIVGRRRTHVRELADVLRIRPRTIEWRLKSLGMMSPERLLGRMVSLHVLWRMQKLEWPLKRIAAVAGFSGPPAMSNYILGHIGLRPTRAAAERRFEDWLALLV